MQFTQQQEGPFGKIKIAIVCFARLKRFAHLPRRGELVR